MNQSLNKLKDENNEQYIFRVCQLKDQLGYTWNQIADILNRELGNNYSESAYRKQWQSFNKMLKANESILFDNGEYLREIQEQKDELYKIKKQVQDQRREYNKLLIADARADHLTEQLIEAANNLREIKPLRYSDCYHYKEGKDKNEAVLCISDIHYGMVTNNIWNVYNTDIAKQRLELLVQKTIRHLDTHEVETLHVLLLGDAAHAAPHVSCRVASEEDTCDQLMHVSELLAEVIYKLSQYVNCLKVYSTYGNHLRTVQNKNDSIHSDNMEKIIPWWLKQRLKDNNKIKIIDSECYEFINFEVCGYDIVATHGDLDNVKNSGMTINSVFNRTYGRSIDYFICADKHHKELYENTGVESILVGSLCGTDEYANNKRLYSYPSQTLMIFNKDDGKLCQYDIRLV